MKSVSTAAWRYLEGATEMRQLACIANKERNKASSAKIRSEECNTLLCQPFHIHIHVAVNTGSPRSALILRRLSGTDDTDTSRRQMKQLHPLKILL